MTFAATSKLAGPPVVLAPRRSGYSERMYPYPAYPFTPWVWRDPGLWGREEADVSDTSDAERDRRRVDLAGYDVEALDGSIGSVDEASYETDNSWLVVDTGPWIFGRKVLLPAGTVQNIDHTEQKVYVDRTKEQIRNAPEYDPDTYAKPEYRERVGQYYDESYRATQ
jgi:hypothetical protein